MVGQGRHSAIPGFVTQDRARPWGFEGMRDEEHGEGVAVSIGLNARLSLADKR